MTADEELLNHVLWKDFVKALTKLGLYDGVWGEAKLAEVICSSYSVLFKRYWLCFLTGAEAENKRMSKST